MPGSLFTRELLVTASRPRALVLKVAIPLVLTVPLLAGHAPTFWAGMLLSVLAAMTGAVGSAISVARARDSGLLARLAVTPRSPGLSMLSWVGGSTVVDAIQLVPALVVIFLLAPVTAPAALSLVLMAISVLFMANVLGSVVAAAGGGAGEVLIDVVVLLAPLLFFGGLFTGVPRDGWRWIAAQVDPFSYLELGVHPRAGRGCRLRRVPRDGGSLRHRGGKCRGHRGARPHRAAPAMSVRWGATVLVMCTLILAACAGSTPTVTLTSLGLPQGGGALAAVTIRTSPDGGIYMNPDPMTVVMVSRAPGTRLIAKGGPDARAWNALQQFGDFTFVGISMHNKGAAGSDPQLNAMQIAADYAPAGTEVGAAQPLLPPDVPACRAEPRAERSELHPACRSRGRRSWPCWCIRPSAQRRASSGASSTSSRFVLPSEADCPRHRRVGG